MKKDSSIELIILGAKFKRAKRLIIDQAVKNQHTRASMARPREFDADKTLLKIMRVFWKQGYERTSFADLERATGLKKASLFAAYGDKETLFCRALERYQQNACSAFSQHCAAGCSPREVIETWLREAGSQGCFSMNTLVEMSPHNRSCAKLVAQHNRAMEEKLLGVIRRAKPGGQAQQIGIVRYLLCVASGMQMISRLKHISVRERNAMVRLALAGVDLG